MTESIFRIEFPEHVPPEKWQYILDQICTDTGASINQLGSHEYEVVCFKSVQVNKVGRTLFHSIVKTKCKVVSTSGEALNQASAYQRPAKVRHSK